MKRFILLAGMLLTLSGGLAACNDMQVQPAKTSDTEAHGGGGY